MSPSINSRQLYRASSLFWEAVQFPGKNGCKEES